MKLETKDEKRHSREIEGILKVTRKGLGFVSSEACPEEDIAIDPAFLNTGLNKDRVKVFLHPKKDGERMTGEVTEIVFRNKLDFVGTAKKIDGGCFIVPDDQKMYADIFVPSNKAGAVSDGDKVFVKITDWSDQKRGPLGEIIKIIGKAGDNNVEMEALVLERGMSTSFPPSVEEAAEKVKELAIIEEEAPVRKDMRDVTTFTIDPKDAKDFDDALSFRVLPNKEIEIGVHIADVSHFVRPGSILDKEATKRGTSIYLVDRTIPMLPEVLSNDLCSLKPNEDKLTFSAVFNFSSESLQEGKSFSVTKAWFGKTIIHSNKRFTYEDAQEVIDKKQGIFFDELNSMNILAKKMEKRREEKGAISFERDEVKFVLDPKGKPLGVYRKKTIDTNKLVENFMLLANHKVADFISGKDENIERTFVYRVHDVPDKDRVTELSNFIKSLGYELKVDGRGPSSKDISLLLKKVKGKKEQGIIETAAMRTMTRAIYSTKNIGHFGLSLSHYTHFTSPIRRYPDVLVHRLLERYLRDEKVPVSELGQYEAMSRYASEMEQLATDAERASIKYKQVEYMSERVGNTYDGVISGVTEWGIYIEEEETKSEGMAPLRNMRDDFYTLDEKNYCLIGERTGKKYSLGDKIKIKVVKADLERRSIDYQIL